ncbi:MAG: hypothetical protein ISS82_05040 [Nanoarchaeota archaeon]|nr:hypothetical protein [Nanoarchaeota archaeon]
MEYSPRTLKCTPRRLVDNLKFLREFGSVPGMDYREELIEFIRGFGYGNLRGKKSFEETENKQLHAVANTIHNNIHRRLRLYKDNLEKALSIWGLEEWEKNIILNINKKLKNGSEDKGDLEEDLYVKLSHLSEIYDYPLRKLFEVLNKNY